jgi:hypothetical protein
MAAGKRGQPGRKSKAAQPQPFEQRLVLFHWLLSLFGASSFNDLVANLRGEELEGVDGENVSLLCRALCTHVRPEKRPHLPDDLLRTYDANILRHWRRITERRNRGGDALYPKYFQYLALLFTEIYLDQYFHGPEELLNRLNAYLEKFNESMPKGSKLPSFQRQELNKVAFWMATGSGKTLLMHVNLLQYRHYLEKCGRERELNRVILLTPNEGLSHQHLEEFQLSGIDAELFSKDGRGLFTGRAVEIIDIHKLRDEMGEKTVAVEAFEGNNLVFVDEGHRGTSSEGGAWMQKRNQLCENGFSFEYSATFGQAIKASTDRSLEPTYAKSILFDYSYKYFYGDGYGKDYHILNLPEDTDELARSMYLTAGLLTFYEQMRLYEDRKAEFRPYNLERPLWIFVGASVNAVRSQEKRKVSDVVDILLMLANFVRERQATVDRIGRLLEGRSGLVDAQQRDLFAKAFRYLRSLPLSAEEVFDDVVRLLFNAPAPAKLHIENLKGTDGEVALRLGNNEPFGLINVGDAGELCKLCEQHEEFAVVEKDFSDSFFRRINEGDSKINILIGSKKFIEGWSSWRVSTMGLMNVGRTEGAQIIQLFGRGVRLKGKNFSLKRSRSLREETAPEHIELLETLNVFGVRADYMKHFREYLENEGVSPDKETIEVVLPVVRNMGDRKLKVVRLKEGIDFKKQGPRPVLSSEPPKRLKDFPLVVDWYPRLEALASAGAAKTDREASKEEGSFKESHLDFLDFDAIYFELQEFKNERGWFNLALPKGPLKELLRRGDWYTLYIPSEALKFRSFRDVERWQEIAVVLLKKYVERFYKFKKQEFEAQHLEYRVLGEDDPNLISEYNLRIEDARKDILKDIENLKTLIETGKLGWLRFGAFDALSFERHLYRPLLYVREQTVVEVKPVVLQNEGECRFVEDLEEYCRSERGKQFLEGKELYLLRNLGRGRGMGFFEAGNFYPDFIMWLIVGERQYVSFVDPKGLRNVGTLEDEKVQFYKTIKELERQLGDPTVILNSFIISVTKPREIHWLSGADEQEREHVLAEHNIFILPEEGLWGEKWRYIETMLRKAIGMEWHEDLTPSAT